MAQRNGEVKVRILTVGFRDTAGLIRMLDSLKKHWKAPAEILVYDNGDSRPAAESWSRSNDTPRLKTTVLGAGKNLGFSAAVNRAAEHPGNWTHLLLVNPDAWFISDVYPETIDLLASQPGIVGLRVFDDEQKKYRQRSARRFPSWITSIANREGLLTRLWPSNPWSQRYLGSDIEPDSAQNVDWVSGCALWVDRKSWEQLRGFDESYFLYVEDVDLGKKAAQAKIPVRYVPAIDFVHEPRGTSKKAPWKADLHHHMGMWIYHIKWSGPLGWFLGPFFFVGIWLRFLLRRL